jgi:hypothetical protein
MLLVGKYKIVRHRAGTTFFTLCAEGYLAAKLAMICVSNSGKKNQYCYPQ